MLAAGPNGAGKTNLLESLHVATQGFSPRTRQDVNLVRFGADGFDVRATGHAQGRQLTVEVGFRVGEGKHAKVDGVAADSLERVRSAAATLVFTPDRLAVVKAGPAVRRGYVDRVIERLFPARARLAAEYSAAVDQRNAALRRVRAGLSAAETVEPWNDRVVEAGHALSEARATAAAALAEPFSACAADLGLDGAGLAYDPSPVSLEELAARFSTDLERGLTGIGPHHDEIRIRAGERELRSHGSQGEQRVAVLSLLLAEAELLSERTGATPLLLLDDVLSELDGDRRAALVERIRTSAQVLVTTAARGALPGDPDQFLEVSPGRVQIA